MTKMILSSNALSIVNKSRTQSPELMWKSNLFMTFITDRFKCKREIWLFSNCIMATYCQVLSISNLAINVPVFSTFSKRLTTSHISLTSHHIDGYTLWSPLFNWSQRLREKIFIIKMWNSIIYSSFENSTTNNIITRSTNSWEDVNENIIEINE